MAIDNKPFYTSASCGMSQLSSSNLEVDFSVSLGWGDNSIVFVCGWRIVQKVMGHPPPNCIFGLTTPCDDQVYNN